MAVDASRHDKGIAPGTEMIRYKAGLRMPQEATKARSLAKTRAPWACGCPFELAMPTNIVDSTGKIQPIAN